MIKFNWKILNRYAKDDKEKVVDFIRLITIKSRRLPTYAINTLNSEINRDSFLLNNKEFVLNELKGSIYERYYYLYLASKRNLADYTYKDILWLPIELCDVAVENNRLIEQTYDKIKFKYEE